MKPNFADCSKEFLDNSNTTYSKYTYNGTVRGIFAKLDRTVFITLEGCRALCGTGSDYYLWKAILSRCLLLTNVIR